MKTMITMILRTKKNKIHHGNQVNPGSDNGWQSWKAATRNLVETLRYE
jgi:hypothetical protein